MDIWGMAGDLSSVVASPATRSAARTLLGLRDPGEALGRMYHFLVWQRTLRIALAHLEAAGADLARLVVPEEVFRHTFPQRFSPVWNLDVPPPISAARLVEIYARHRRLLAAPVAALQAADVDCFVLVSGRAYEARYPEYRHRVEFDTDLVVPDPSSAVRVATALAEAGYPLDTVWLHRLGAAPEAIVEIRRREEGHLVSIGLLVGGYHRHRGDISGRAGLVPFRDGLARAAAPEDLLVMLAARAERKRTFAHVNVNDAAVILDADGDGIDWDVVCGEASVTGLGASLAVVLEGAERVLMRSAVPAEVTTRLMAAPGARLRRSIARRAATSAMGGDGGWVSQAAQRTWAATSRLRRGPQGAGPGVAGRLAVAAQRRILTAQLARIGAGRAIGRPDRLLTRLRTRSGTLCEIAPSLAAPEGCLAALGGWRGSPAAAGALRSLGESLPPIEGDHACRRLRFDLAVRSGE